MRVLVADGEPGVRSALRLVLTHDLGMQVVGEVTDRAELWTQVQRTTPDLLVLNWEWIGAEDAALPARLRASLPDLRIVALSSHPEVRPRALAAGADAHISKTDLPSQVRETLRAVTFGGEQRG
jgi:DNA-binding NarL/FixJ family response regulator